MYPERSVELAECFSCENAPVIEPEPERMLAVAPVQVVFEYAPESNVSFQLHECFLNHILS